MKRETLEYLYEIMEADIEANGGSNYTDTDYLKAFTDIKNTLMFEEETYDSMPIDELADLMNTLEDIYKKRVAEDIDSEISAQIVRAHGEGMRVFARGEEILASDITVRPD